MKKTKLLTSLALASVAITPVIYATSCSKKNPYAKQIALLKKQAINEFMELSKYPRRTGYTKPVYDYLKSQIETLGFEFHHDEYDSGTGQGNGNIWFDVPATKGLENKPVLALQAHMDMVLAGINEVVTEKAKINGINAIRTTQNGHDVIISKDHETSLGGDDGFGIATILAIAKSTTLKHGPLRMIITTDEEGTTAGALNFGKGVEGGGAKILEPVKGLINLDDEIENELTVASAGNSNVTLTANNLETAELGQLSTFTYCIEVSGLKGGHSGDCINEGRHNANKVIVDIFKALNDDSLQAVYYSNPGVTSANSITPTAKMVFCSNIEKTKINEVIDQEIIKIKQECKLDENVQISLTQSYTPSNALTVVETKNFINTLDELKFGVIDMVKPTLVGNSQNLALVSLDLTATSQLSILLMPRATTEEQIKKTQADDENVMKKYFDDKYSISTTPITHGWIAADDDIMTKLTVEGYNQQGITPKLAETHAGIECAEFAHYKEGLYMSSIGPKVDDAHSVEETFYLDTLNGVIWTVLYVIDHFE